MTRNMDFTGERFVPEEHGDIELEHLHRYLLACEITGGKVVLDIASGEGYGSAMLAEKAGKVFGVDISLEAINHARSRYNKENLEYLVGSCADIPIPDHSVDVVVSFETIEHHDQHEKMMKEIKRVLRPSGVLLISSPDKLYFSNERGFTNEYHIKELYKHELDNLLKGYFNKISYFGQRIIFGSILLPKTISSSIITFSKDGDVIKKSPGIAKPLYWIAIASDGELPQLPVGILEQSIDDSQIVHSWYHQVANRDLQIASLNEQIASLNEQIASLNEQIICHNKQVNKLEIIINERDQLISGLLNTVEEQKANNSNLIKIISERDQSIENIFSSTSWLVTKPIRWLGHHTRKPSRNQQKGIILQHQQEDILVQHQQEDILVQNALKQIDADFCSQFYLKAYPDVALAGMDPYEHYIKYGKTAGRIGNVPKLKVPVGIEWFNPSHETILVVSHEGSRTGAPILSYNLIKHFSVKYNIIALFLGSGPIIEASRLIGAAVLEEKQLSGGEMPYDFVIDYIANQSQIKFALVNSIESRRVLQSLSTNHIPTVTLIHEFAAYTRPYHALYETVLWSGHCVFSSPITRDNAIMESEALKECHFSVLPQGRCITPIENILSEQAITQERQKTLEILRPSSFPNDGLVVLGAGFVHIRKGIDLFIECAGHIVRKASNLPVRFVWIGKGFNPESDMNYSVYLADQVQRAGLDTRFFFLDEVSDLSSAYNAADIFVLSSRLDPLPNVAIEALASGLPLICFDKATGIADILHEYGLGETCVANYFDTENMACKVLALAKSKELRTKYADLASKIIVNVFNMDRYIERIEELAEEESKRTRQEIFDIETISKSELLRLDYFLLNHQVSYTPNEAIHLFIKSWSSGINKRKLFPGFHPGIYLEQHGIDSPYANPLADYIRSGMPEGSWKYRLISPNETLRKLHHKLRIALHIHVYYLDLLPDILKRINLNQVRPDLLISVVDEDTLLSVKEIISSYPGYTVDIRIVPNRGRDIGPLLTEFGNKIITDYDIIGHVHTKKSLHFKDKSFGFNWNFFLLENLLGGTTAMADIIISNMANEPNIGMVFPDDPYVIGWGENITYIKKYSQLIGIHTLPKYINFPIGTMFWASTKALKDVFDLNLHWNDYPPEPLPYDGSILHGLERLFVLSVEKNGFNIANTNIKGITR